jgi:hypothetical protein
MTEENTILDFNAAINALNSVSESFKIGVYIPSKEKTIYFKEIDAKQQKTLLSSAMDNSVYNSEFVKTFYSILKENILSEEKSVVDELTVSDKSFIAIALKSQISEELTVKFNDDISSKINLNDVISRFNDYKTPNLTDVELKNETVSLIVGVSLPTIKTEVEYEENFYNDYKKIDDIKTNKDVQAIISDAFISETSKYINYVTINGAKYDFNTLTFNQKLRVVEKLPSGLIQKVLAQVSEWKNDIDSILTVTNGDLKKVITIDSLLFLS